MKTNIRLQKAVALGALSFFLGCVDAGTPTSNAAASKEAALRAPSFDSVVDWNEIAEQSVVVVAKHPPPVAALDFAILHAAIYDAVEAIDGKYRPYHVMIPGAHGSLNAAASKAAHDILVFLFPAQQASLDATYASYFSDHGLSTADPGVDVGAQAAAGIIVLRTNDGRFPPNPPPSIGNTAIGQWRPTPSYNAGQPPAGLLPMLTPWVANVKLFALKSNDQFMPAGPTPLDSREWQKDYNETKDFGSLDSTVRTAEQTTIGLFWADSGPLLWQRAQRDLATRYLPGPAQSARMFALTNLAAADAQIACWHSKETFNFWRPVTAISLGGGNPNLEADPNWKPLINTPNFPEYTSGHTTSSAAAVGVLKRFFHDRDTTFTVTSKYPWSPQTQRTFDRFDDALDEVIDARVWVGIHWRSSDVDGAMWGKKIANYVFSHYLHRADDEDEGDRATVDNDRGPNGHDTTDPNDEGADVSSD